MSQIVLLVVGALVGLLASQGGEWLRLRREEHRAFGRALKTLLYIRSYLYSIKKTKEFLVEHFNLPSQQLIHFQYFMQAFVLPSPDELLENHKEAIEAISGVDPLLGLSLTKQTQLLPVIMRLIQVAGQTEEASAVWLSLEVPISDTSVLDDLILEVAELHSIDTHSKVKHYLNEPITLPSDVENLFKDAAKVATASTLKREV